LKKMASDFCDSKLHIQKRKKCHISTKNSCSLFHFFSLYCFLRFRYYTHIFCSLKTIHISRSKNYTRIFMLYPKNLSKIP
jgi:hypothetical protein